MISVFMLTGALWNGVLFPISLEVDSQSEISSSHGGEYEDQNLLGCTAVFLIECLPTFQRYVLPPSSGRLVDGDSTYPWTVGRHSIKNMAVHPRRFWASDSQRFTIMVLLFPLLCSEKARQCHLLFSQSQFTSRIRFVTMAIQPTLNSCSDGHHKFIFNVAFVECGGTDHPTLI
jgi:hypothetical protein